jgi:electron transfer flavoprotein alpha/beta subunit
MKVIVILGQVLDPRGIVVNRRVGRIFVNREEYILQPADACALEAVLRIKDSASDTEVVALPRGPLPDDDVLRQALSIGADRAVYLTGDGFEKADDAVAARVLAAAIERLGGVALVLTGATTLDTGQGQLGPRLAEALGWSQIVGAWAVRMIGERVEVVRQEGASYVIHQADLPVVVTVVPGALKPRYPDGVRLINVYRDEDAVETWNAADLVDEGALQPVLEKRGQDFPPQRERGARLEGTPGEMAQALAEALRQRVQI